MGFTCIWNWTEAFVINSNNSKSKNSIIVTLHLWLKWLSPHSWKGRTCTTTTQTSWNKSGRTVIDSDRRFRKTQFYASFTELQCIYKHKTKFLACTISARMRENTHTHTRGTSDVPKLFCRWLRDTDISTLPNVLTILFRKLEQNKY